ncbi:MAG: OmpA family protein [Hyphomicrobiales bacterium]|nr:OmpA family protein [Hyphomicrobiales bacterium]
MKYLVSLLVSGLFGFTATLMDVQAQNRVTYSQVMQSLVTSGKTARRVGIDTGVIRQDIENHIRAEGTENAQTSFSVLDELKKLPQLIVQIQFDLDSDSIRPESWVTIGRIADALHHPLLAGNRFLIIGHTDARGKRLYNLGLSQRRALSIVEMLTSTFRINPMRLVALGLGEEQLLDTGKPNNGVNRRVELLNMGPT